MYINNYFNTTIWSEQKPEFIKSLTKASNKYIKAAKNNPEAKAHIKEVWRFWKKLSFNTTYS
jgi:ABC-type nitrate/sulfonate/bicarbonate transport system substrate-binding protein